MRRKILVSIFRHFYMRIPASFRSAALYPMFHSIAQHGAIAPMNNKGGQQPRRDTHSNEQNPCSGYSGNELQ